MELTVLAQAVPPDLVTAESGIAAVIGAALTLVSVKVLDYFFKKSGRLDQRAINEATAIRKELREEVRQLKGDLYQLVVDNDELRNEYFDIRDQHSDLLLERNGLEMERNMYRALSEHYKVSIEELATSTEAGEPVILKLEKILAEVVVMEEDSEPDDES